MWARTGICERLCCRSSWRHLEVQSMQGICIQERLHAKFQSPKNWWSCLQHFWALLVRCRSKQRQQSCQINCNYVRCWLTRIDRLDSSKAPCWLPHLWLALSGGTNCRLHKDTIVAVCGCHTGIAASNINFPNFQFFRNLWVLVSRVGALRVRKAECLMPPRKIIYETLMKLSPGFL